MRMERRVRGVQRGISAQITDLLAAARLQSVEFHVRPGLPQPLEHFRRPCAGVLFAYVRAVDEKDIRLFSADGKRRQDRRKREERSRDAAANLPRFLYSVCHGKSTVTLKK